MSPFNKHNPFSWPPINLNQIIENSVKNENGVTFYDCQNTNINDLLKGVDESKQKLKQKPFNSILFVIEK
jgi:hypothetical protein